MDHADHRRGACGPGLHRLLTPPVRRRHRPPGDAGDAGAVDLEAGEGFHGLIRFDFDGDNVADVATYIVGPDGEIPRQAKDNGAPCAGVVNFEALFACMPG